MGKPKIIDNIENTKTITYIVELTRWGITNGLPTRTTTYTETDYTNAYNNILGINNALEWAYVNGYRSVKMPKGNYAVCYAKVSDNRKLNAICINFDNFTFDMNGSTFKVIYDSDLRSPYDKTKSGEIYVTSTNPTYYFNGVTAIMFVYDCKNTTVCNGKIIGDKVDRTFSTQEEKCLDYTNGINAGGGCKNITIRDIDVSMFTADGLTSGSSGSVNNTYVNASMYMGWQLGSLDSSGALISSITQCISDFQAVNSSSSYFLLGYGYTQGMGTLVNKKYSVYFYDINKTFITKLSTFVMREFVTSTFTKYVRFVVDETSVASDGWQMNFYKGMVGSFVTFKNNYIHHNHRGGMSIGVHDMFITNNHFYNNGEVYDYENDLPGFQNSNGTAQNTRYHINMEDSQAYNINIIGNRFENGNIGVALRGYNYIINDNVFKNCGIVLYKLHYAIVKNNHITDGSFVGFPYDNYVRNWVIDSNIIGDLQIDGTAIVEAITNNVILGKVTIAAEVKNFKGNNFKIEKDIGYSEYITLNTIPIIEGCIFDKLSSEKNSISLTKGIYVNCKFKNIKVNAKNVVFINCVSENASFVLNTSVETDNLAFIRCQFNQDDTYAIASKYPGYPEDSATVYIANTGRIEIVDSLMTSSANTNIFSCYNFNNVSSSASLKLHRSKIIKTVTNKIGLKTFNGTLDFVDSTITSDVATTSYTPNASLNHTFSGCTFTNVPIVTKSTDNIYTKDDLSILANPLTGNGSPSITPRKIGQEFYDTTNKKLYKAFGISSSSDWVIMN